MDSALRREADFRDLRPRSGFYVLPERRHHRGERSHAIRRLIQALQGNLFGAGNDAIALIGVLESDVSIGGGSFTATMDDKAANIVKGVSLMDHTGYPFAKVVPSRIGLKQIAYLFCFLLKGKRKIYLYF